MVRGWKASTKKRKAKNPPPKIWDNKDNAPANSMSPWDLYNQHYERVLQKFGGNLASNGSTTHFFENLGVIQFSKDEISDEKALDIAATVGAKDCLNYKDFHEIITIKEDFYRVKNQIEKLIKKINYSGIEWRPQNKVSINKEDEKEMLNLLELLQEDDDIQKIFHNYKLV